MRINRYFCYLFYQQIVSRYIPQIMKNKVQTSQLIKAYQRFTPFHSHPINLFIHILGVPIFSIAILQIIHIYTPIFYSLNILHLIFAVTVAYYVYLDIKFGLAFVPAAYATFFIWNTLFKMMSLQKNVANMLIIIGLALFSQLVIGHAVFQKKNRKIQLSTLLELIQNPFIIFIKVCSIAGISSKVLQPFSEQKGLGNGKK